MKSFIFSCVFLLILLAAINIYYMNLSDNSEIITNLANKIEKYILNDESEKCKDAIYKLEKSFNDMQNKMMLFEDHGELIKITQTLELLKVYSVNFNKEEMLAQLSIFKILINNSIENITPNLKNIL